MTRKNSKRMFLVSFLLAGFSLIEMGGFLYAETRVLYNCDATRLGEHVFHIQIQVITEGLDAIDFQMPAWNGLYQIRDFAHRVRLAQAFNQDRLRLPVEKIDKQTWRVKIHGVATTHFEYDVYANENSPYSSQLDVHHGFLNGGNVFMYPVGKKTLPVQVRFLVPENWRIATELSPVAEDNVFEAKNYDSLVDTPVEMGTFRRLQFEARGVQFSVILDTESAQFDEQELIRLLKRLVETEFDLMRDVPLKHYTFIYHFSSGLVGGGMEHAFSTAIHVNAGEVSRRLESLAGVTAHEFFHLWNVKRIRPASLEPIDYTKENYTRALWFSEGVTSLYAAYILVRSGVESMTDFYHSLAQTIESEQSRPAHLIQSAEESSLDTWFDKYSFYRRPANSISYYEKGKILGLLLDLMIRTSTNNSSSLDDILRYLNTDVAQKGLYFDDRQGIPLAVERVTGHRFDDFFNRYVHGVDEIDYNSFLRAAGLTLEIKLRNVADLGFAMTQNFDGSPMIDEVFEGGRAEKAGIKRGDELIAINGIPATRTALAKLSSMEGNKKLSLKLRRNGQTIETAFETGTKKIDHYEIVESPNTTPLQAAIRTGILTGR